MLQRPALRVAIRPARSKRNPFIRHFATSLAENGLHVMHFGWNPLTLLRSDVLILHWPDDLFQAATLLRRLKAFFQRAVLAAARRLRGTRIIWVAHNVRPHEASAAPSRAEDFISGLSGIIYLSAASRAEMHARYPAARGLPELVTVHGHYLLDMESAPVPSPAIDHSVRLAFAGQIRPYKNIELLGESVAALAAEAVSLSITGMAIDRGLTARLKALAQKAPNITLHAGRHALPDRAMEQAIDDAHAVVLPYRDITNSGAAFLALSHNRPVLAPRLGGLPEVQAKVGSDWLYLYEGEFNAKVLKEFIAWLRARPALPAPDLSAYDWEPIGRDVAGFINKVMR